MEALVNNVYPTSELATVDSSDPMDDLVMFSRKPSDSRFLSNNFACLTPNEPISKDMKEISFSQSRTNLPLYSSLNEIYVAVTATVTKTPTDGGTPAAVEDADNVAPLAFLPDTLWESFEIYFNDTQVACSHKYRHITAHMGRILSYPKTAFAAYSGPELGFIDDKYNGDDTHATNTSFVSRKNKCLGEKKIHMLGLLTTDISSLSSLVIPNVDIRFRLTRNSDKKIFMCGVSSKTATKTELGTKGFQLNLHDVQLFFRRPLLSDTVFRSHTKMLNSGKDNPLPKKKSRFIYHTTF